ncbi:alpha/beta hydrolase [Agromyces sp. ISL-38]|uniref:alpha/beta fold hydrolase n=1 Tax=Agromyces sp. ISL-38 TaxID=2819107 RepID=UPI001BEC840E|nr:alpha/beta hydrolase [Agromyces sp. ISL-38]MBT2498023.1 alpha/beta hydrolase [Agromyces sp. ISL-38]MBT2516902.1 alpha/beta hydrolase [Streptomyces sp. ISL-90]
MPRVLLIHGLSSSPAGLWRVRHWLEDAGWTTEAIALRGHGGQRAAVDYALPSYASDLAPTGPWDAVVAHSLGASAATLVAAADPGWAARLVLFEPVWRIPAEEEPTIIADQRAELALTRPQLEAEKPHWDPRDIDAKLASIAQVDPEAVTRTFTDTGRWDLTDAAGRLGIPTLVVSGDPQVYTMLDPADAAAIAKRAPLVDYRVVPGAGHSPHYDAPDATRELMLSWLTEAS